MRRPVFYYGIIVPYQSSLPYLFPRTAVTNYHNLVASHKRNLFSPSSGGQRFEIKVWTGPDSF